MNLLALALLQSFSLGVSVAPPASPAISVGLRPAVVEVVVAPTLSAETQLANAASLALTTTEYPSTRPREFENRATGKYFGARYYRANVGRFTTIDPVYTWEENLVDPQRWNRYAYARNNPLKFVDPDGKFIVPAVVVALGLFIVLNNPTNLDVTSGPTASTIIPNSVGVAGAGGFAAGGIRVMGREVAEEVSGIPSPRDLLQALHGFRKTASEMADTLAGKLGKNSVPFETSRLKGHIDLKGAEHFDKATQAFIPTPHVQTRPKHIGPNGRVNLGPETITPATKADIRTAEKLAERKPE